MKPYIVKKLWKVRLARGETVQLYIKHERDQTVQLYFIDKFGTRFNIGLHEISWFDDKMSVVINEEE
jgi:hypothetical protein